MHSEPESSTPPSARTRTARKALRLSSAALALVTIAAGGAALVNDGAGTSPTSTAAGAAFVRNAAFAASTGPSSADAAVNESLDSMAKIFASAVADKDFRRAVRDGAAQRFDGDNDILWKDLSAKSGVRGHLADTYSRERAAGKITPRDTSSARSATSTLNGVSNSSNVSTLSATDALSDVEALAADIPRFQVSVPRNLDAWDPEEYTPLVAYMPEGVDDTTLETVTAYDAAGNAYELDAQEEPDVPVIVLGVNERTDDAGNLTYEPALTGGSTAVAATADATNGVATATFASATAPDYTNGAVVSPAALTAYEVRMVKVHLLDDKEPWARGAAEIALRAKSVGCSGVSYTDYDWASLNDSEDWWIGPRLLGTSRCDVSFYWWEDDGNDWDFTLSYKGVSLNVKMDAGDDLIGGIQRAYSTFKGGSDNKSSWSALDQWTD